MATGAGKGEEGNMIDSRPTRLPVGKGWQGVDALLELNIESENSRHLDFQERASNFMTHLAMVLPNMNHVLLVGDGSWNGATGCPSRLAA